MNKQEAIEVIDNEIDWCLEHPSTSPSKEFQDGFLSGLNQARNLLSMCSDED